MGHWQTGDVGRGGGGGKRVNIFHILLIFVTISETQPLNGHQLKTVE